MKKIISLTMVLTFIMGVTVFAAPQTNINQGKTSLDIGIFNSKITTSDNTGDTDWDKKANIDLGITAGVSDKYAIQYKYHKLDSDDTNMFGITANANCKTQEFNVLYKLDNRTNVFVGVNKVSGSVEFLGRSKDIDSKNKFQVGITTVVPLSKQFDAWGTLAGGSDLVSCELGISHPLSSNTDLNVYYRYIKFNDLKIDNVSNYSIDGENNGFGLGVTVKF